MNLVERFKKGMTVVNCQTEQQAENFVIWCYKNNIRWGDELGNNGNNILNTHYYIHFNETCYRCCDGYLVYGGKNEYDKIMVKIVTYEKFFKDKEIRLIKNKEMELSDLKSGQQVVKIRNGERYLVLKNDKHFLNFIGIDKRLGDEMSYDDNMLYLFGDHDKDIVAVYDIMVSGYGIDLQHILKQGLGLKLVWKRKEEVKEMTLDEVNKVLQDTKGFKVKIVEQRGDK